MKKIYGIFQFLNRFTTRGKKARYFRKLEKEIQFSMFEEEDKKLKKIASCEVISKYTRERLKAIFSGVSNKPLVLPATTTVPPPCYIPVECNG